MKLKDIALKHMSNDPNIYGYSLVDYVPEENSGMITYIYNSGEQKTIAYEYNNGEFIDNDNLENVGENVVYAEEHFEYIPKDEPVEGIDTSSYHEETKEEIRGFVPLAEKNGAHLYIPSSPYDAKDETTNEKTSVDYGVFVVKEANGEINYVDLKKEGIVDLKTGELYKGTDFTERIENHIKEYRQEDSVEKTKIFYQGKEVTDNGKPLEAIYSFNTSICEKYNYDKNELRNLAKNVPELDNKAYFKIARAIDLGAITGTNIEPKETIENAESRLGKLIDNKKIDIANMHSRIGLIKEIIIEATKTDFIDSKDGERVANKFGGGGNEYITDMGKATLILERLEGLKSTTGIVKDYLVQEGYKYNIAGTKEYDKHYIPIKDEYKEIAKIEKEYIKAEESLMTSVGTSPEKVKEVLDVAVKLREIISPRVNEIVEKNNNSDKINDVNIEDVYRKENANKIEEIKEKAINGEFVENDFTKKIGLNLKELTIEIEKNDKDIDNEEYESEIVKIGSFEGGKLDNSIVDKVEQKIESSIINACRENLYPTEKERVDNIIKDDRKIANVCGVFHSVKADATITHAFEDSSNRRSGGAEVIRHQLFFAEGNIPGPKGAIAVTSSLIRSLVETDVPIGDIATQIRDSIDVSKSNVDGQVAMQEGWNKEWQEDIGIKRINEKIDEKIDKNFTAEDNKTSDDFTKREQDIGKKETDQTERKSYFDKGNYKERETKEEKESKQEQKERRVDRDERRRESSGHYDENGNWIEDGGRGGKGLTPKQTLVLAGLAIGSLYVPFITIPIAFGLFVHAHKKAKNAEKNDTEKNQNNNVEKKQESFTEKFKNYSEVVKNVREGNYNDTIKNNTFNGVDKADFKENTKRDIIDSMSDKRLDKSVALHNINDFVGKMYDKVAPSRITTERADFYEKTVAIRVSDNIKEENKITGESIKSAFNKIGAVVSGWRQGRTASEINVATNGAVKDVYKDDADKKISFGKVISTAANLLGNVTLSAMKFEKLGAFKEKMHELEKPDTREERAQMTKEYAQESRDNRVERIKHNAHESHISKERLNTFVNNIDKQEENLKQEKNEVKQDDNNVEKQTTTEDKGADVKENTLSQDEKKESEITKEEKKDETEKQKNNIEDIPDGTGAEKVEEEEPDAKATKFEEYKDDVDKDKEEKIKTDIAAGAQAEEFYNQVDGEKSSTGKEETDNKKTDEEDTDLEKDQQTLDKTTDIQQETTTHEPVVASEEKTIDYYTSNDNIENEYQTKLEDNDSDPEKAKEAIIADVINAATEEIKEEPDNIEGKLEALEDIIDNIFNEIAKTDDSYNNDDVRLEAKENILDDLKTNLQENKADINIDLITEAIDTAKDDLVKTEYEENDFEDEENDIENNTNFFDHVSDIFSGIIDAVTSALDTVVTSIADICETISDGINGSSIEDIATRVEMDFVDTNALLEANLSADYTTTNQQTEKDMFADAFATDMFSEDSLNNMNTTDFSANNDLEQQQIDQNLTFGEMARQAAIDAATQQPEIIESQKIEAGNENIPVDYSEERYDEERED